jgi:hypothetical protein
MRLRFLSLVVSAVALSCVAGCASAGPGVYLMTGGDGRPFVEDSLAPGEVRLKPSVCKDSPELAPEFATLDENAVVKFFAAQGFKSTKVRARTDLVYVDVTIDEHHDPVRLRVAILPTTADAGYELHEAILQHGPGSWGVHRSNLAVLAPIGTTDEMIAFAAKTKLACWGVLTFASRDDTFVVPGGYTEL